MMIVNNGKKAGLISATVFLIILIALGAVIYISLGKGIFTKAGSKFSESKEKVTAEAMNSFKTQQLLFLHKVVGEDECNNGRGYAIRGSEGRSCINETKNNYSNSSFVEDCCCCNVTTHVLDFGEVYAYKKVRIYLVPQTNSNTITINVSSSVLSDSNFIHICDKTLDMSNRTIINDTGEYGFIFDCYINTDSLNKSQFRYLKVKTNTGFINYIKAEVLPELRICKKEPTDNLTPGEGYWVYSSADSDKNVTIKGWDYLSPVAIILASPLSAATSVPISFSGEKSYTFANCKIETYKWDFGDGNRGTGKNINHTYKDDGQYKVKLTVTEENSARNSNCNGLSTTTFIYITISNQYPIPKITVTRDDGTSLNIIRPEGEFAIRKEGIYVNDTNDGRPIYENDTLTFDGSLSTDDSRISKYNWSIYYSTANSTEEYPYEDSGIIYSTNSMKFDYTLEYPGIYQAVLNVTDDEDYSAYKSVFVRVEKYICNESNQHICCPFLMNGSFSNHEKLCEWERNCEWVGLHPTYSNTTVFSCIGKQDNSLSQGKNYSAKNNCSELNGELECLSFAKKSADGAWRCDWFNNSEYIWKYCWLNFGSTPPEAYFPPDERDKVDKYLWYSSLEIYPQNPCVGGTVNIPFYSPFVVPINEDACNCTRYINGSADESAIVGLPNCSIINSGIQIELEYNYTTPKENPGCYDINGDGYFNETDVILEEKEYFDNSTSKLYDINGDGEVNKTDLDIIYDNYTSLIGGSVRDNCSILKRCPDVNEDSEFDLTDLQFMMKLVSNNFSCFGDENFRSRLDITADGCIDNGDLIAIKNFWSSYPNPKRCGPNLIFLCNTTNETGLCMDNIDNDCDGDIDGNDSDCQIIDPKCKIFDILNDMNEHEGEWNGECNYHGNKYGLLDKFFIWFDNGFSAIISFFGDTVDGMGHHVNNAIDSFIDSTHRVPVSMCRFSCNNTTCDLNNEVSPIQELLPDQACTVNGISYSFAPDYKVGEEFVDFGRILSKNISFCGDQNSQKWCSAGLATACDFNKTIYRCPTGNHSWFCIDNSTSICRCGHVGDTSEEIECPNSFGSDCNCNGFSANECVFVSKKTETIKSREEPYKNNLNILCEDKGNYSIITTDTQGYSNCDNVGYLIPSDGAECEVKQFFLGSLFSLPICSNYLEKKGSWDQSDAQCVQCNNIIHTEEAVIGNKSRVYLIGGEGETFPPPGDYKCESACGADPYCDEVEPYSYPNNPECYGTVLEICDQNCKKTKTSICYSTKYDPNITNPENSTCYQNISESCQFKPRGASCCYKKDSSDPSKCIVGGICSDNCECVKQGSYWNFQLLPGVNLISYPLLKSQNASWIGDSYTLCGIVPGLSSVTGGEGTLDNIVYYNTTTECDKLNTPIVYFQPDKSYLVDLRGINPNGFTLWGEVPGDRIVTMHPGWNWFGFTSMSRQPVKSIFNTSIFPFVLTAAPNCSNTSEVFE